MSPERVSLLQTLEPPKTTDYTSSDTLSSNNWDPETELSSISNLETRSKNRDTASSSISHPEIHSRDAKSTITHREGTSDTSKIQSSLSMKGSSTNSDRDARQTDNKPVVFDRNKVSLDFPGSLFGPSLSLLIKTTKIVGDVIQNSAVRYQSFLRLFRPLFRGQFEIKGLDPPTTTTTTTTTTTKAPVAADNEVRRR